MNRGKRNMIKDAFDHLPSGVCFFDRNGVVTLCNHRMHWLAFALTGRDVQYLDEMLAVLEGRTDVPREGDSFLLDDGSVWRFSRQEVTVPNGGAYTQIVASDVTELYYRQKELERDNQRLEQAGRRLRRLSANVVAVTREEEILNMKMRVHDDIGRSVIASRRLLQQQRPTGELDLTPWKNAVRLLRHDSESPEDKDALGQLVQAAEGIGVHIVLNGTLPEDPAAAYLLITAMRECASNAARHAGASELYVALSIQKGTAGACITNNGILPKGAMTEGGGLSSLRTRIEKAGGKMTVRCSPGFTLTVRVPCREGGEI